MNNVKKYIFYSVLFVLILLVLGCYFIFNKKLKNDTEHKPMVSVIISSYNMADTLPASIDSIFKQTYQDFEVIVIDDGSADNTSKVLKKYKNNPRVHIIKNIINIGLPMSLNRGILAAKGKYIARLDADDISYPDRFERQVKFMEEHNIDLCGGDFDVQGRKSHPRHPDINSTSSLGMILVENNVFAHSSVMMRKSFLDEHKLFYSPFRPNAEDYDLWIRIFVNRGKLALLGNKPIIMHHQSYHSKKWWNRCSKSATKSRRKALKKIIPNATSNIVDLKHCDLFARILEANPETKYFDQEMLKREHYSCVKKQNSKVTKK